MEFVECIMEKELLKHLSEEFFDFFYLHSTCKVIASWTLLCKASLFDWQVYTTSFISCVTLIFKSNDDTVPPHNPGFDVAFTPSTGMPSFHQETFAGGLLELESQIIVASMPGTNSSGSTRILTVSGATEKKNWEND